MSRWLGMHAAALVWGGGICARTMQRMCERWRDASYALGMVDVTPGGHWRVREDFLRREWEKKGTVLQPNKSISCRSR